jgi:hypothetical protein
MIDERVEPLQERLDALIGLTLCHLLDTRKPRDIIVRLAGLGVSRQMIASVSGLSSDAVRKVLERSGELTKSSSTKRRRRLRAGG